MIVRPPRSFAPRPTDNPLDALQHEILQEKASTLGRLTQGFETALAELRRFDAETGPDRDALQVSRRTSCSTPRPRRSGGSSSSASLRVAQYRGRAQGIWGTGLGTVADGREPTQLSLAVRLEQFQP
jgi:hypothetical protein